jgi:hypothetical protein
MTSSIPAVDPTDFNNRYESLVKIIKHLGTEAQSRVAVHIRAITDGRQGSLGIYHVTASIPMAEKFHEYARIASALGISKDANGKPVIVGPDYSKLKGQLGLGAKQADGEDPAETTAVAPPVPEMKLPTDRSITPAVSNARSAGEGDDLAAAIIRAIQGKIPVTGPAQNNDGHIRAIVAEEFEKLNLHDAIKKANLNGAFPMDRVTKLIEELVAKAGHRIEIVGPGGEVKSISGAIHPQVTQLVAWLNAGVPAWAWSAAGSGKTHMARQIAEIMGVTPYVISVDPTLTVAKLLGYRNVANGEFVPGFLYQAYKEGGLVALDEIDTGDPGVIASLNALLSNSHYLFPNNETVERHARFHVLALANTKGTGAIAGYTARNRLDAATLDRFAVIEIQYDPGLELLLSTGSGVVGQPWKPTNPATVEHQVAYTTWVQKVRAQVGNSVLVSPRASINGCKALRAGIPMSEVMEALVFKLVADDTRKRITDTCELPLSGYIEKYA